MNNIDLILSSNSNLNASSGSSKAGGSSDKSGFLSELQAVLATLAGGSKQAADGGKNIRHNNSNAMQSNIMKNIENNSPAMQFGITENMENNSPQVQKMPTEIVSNAESFPWILSAGKESSEREADLANMPALMAILDNVDMTAQNTETDKDASGANFMSAAANAGAGGPAKPAISDIDPVVDDIRAEITAAEQAAKTAKTTESATVSNLPAGKLQEDMTTTERYIAHFEEMLQAAKEILAMVKQGRDSDDEQQAGSTAEAETINQNATAAAGSETKAAQGSANTTSQTHSNSAFIDNMMDVMPKNTNPSQAAAETKMPANVKTAETPDIQTAEMADADAEIVDTLLQQAAKQAETKPASASINTVLTNIDEEIEVISSQNAMASKDKKEGERSGTQEKTTAVKPVPEKAEAVQAPAEDKKSETKTVSEKTTQNESISMADNNKAKTGTTFDSVLKTAVKHSDDTQTTANLTDTTAKINQAQAPQQETKFVDRVLQWESARDAVNLAKMVQQAGQNGATKLTVRLTPENLGRIEIQLTEIGGRIDAKITANSHESRTFLTSHGEAIIKQLNERGIHIDNMDFNFHDSQAKQSNADSGGHGGKRSSGQGDSRGDNTGADAEHTSNIEDISTGGLYA